MLVVLAVGFGGFLGTVLRYLLTLIPVSEKTAFPVITLLINLFGALAIGILAGFAARYKGIDSNLMAFLRVGICGGFTTFSTFALEITNLFDAGRVWMGAVYMLLSMVLGVAAVLAGKTLIR